MTFNRRETLETLAATCPGLADDHLAMAVLSKPEMLALLMKKDVLKRVARERPALFDALNVLAATVHEEQSSQASNSKGPSFAPFAYAMDHMDDDDMGDEEDDEGMDYEGGAPMAGAGAVGGGAAGITSDALSAALAQAQAVVGGGVPNAGAGAGRTGRRSGGEHPPSDNVFGGLFSVS